ncbi:MAG: UDP-2,3-diacylglucosamine diphosphatase [Planctomycetota bacterium]|nr:UDP-2,3-diacylglucosamine diphosphatase [Planctomycetota bacterium]MDP7249348.1 UDP-2,3-diacylglucosamine diphosphatase [Planctomycetota bacterium]
MSASSSKPIVVFGDCHLAVGVPTRTRLVMDFLDGLPGYTEHIIILGDLFDFWLGAKHLLLPDFTEVLDKLRSLTDQGISINLTPGNRDFLLDHHFVDRTGVTLMSDFHDIEMAGKTIRLTHGDLLCTSDWRYRIWRTVVRNPIVKAFIAFTPLFFTKWMAVQMRRVSQSEVKQKNLQGLGFQEAAASKVMQDDAVALVAGHAHVPHTKTILVDEDEKAFYVCGDWAEIGIYITLEPDGIFHRVFPSADREVIEVRHFMEWIALDDRNRIDPVPYLEKFQAASG